MADGGHSFLIDGVLAHLMASLLIGRSVDIQSTKGADEEKVSRSNFGSCVRPVFNHCPVNLDHFKKQAGNFPGAEYIIECVS